ncbi:RNA polymerase sigma factor [Parabacteroides sp. 52]|uniref:RNA polymerase sigma factor n=1 Tax=unclassified Parabacteroides TaxID=2649774 RepID=UPI0013D44D66|nr:MULTISPECIES: RNA polymerase sigma factor [unclassified Parabacteroides]MDH6535739.1 RNA polymerase sigma factor (sigma-70 family) [Parabacteroides sp. PM5-20]NDV56356.1 RNA polymerase sigma factor [Parabacteroides sp. 52]
MHNAISFQKELLGIEDKMMNLALLLTSNKEDAQDLFQETTLKVLDNQEKFINNVNFKGWVLTVMRNIFINNYHRLIRTYTLIDQDTDIYNLDNNLQSGMTEADSAIDLQEITKAIKSLNKEIRTPFSMYISGYKYNEIAERLNLQLGTVKSRIFTARQELQKELKDFYSY